jgi:hypothetical protein
MAHGYASIASAGFAVLLENRFAITSYLHGDILLYAAHGESQCGIQTFTHC